jgi:hypothetical protein
MLVVVGIKVFEKIHVVLYAKEQYLKLPWVCNLFTVFQQQTQTSVLMIRLKIEQILSVTHKCKRNTR